jgi:hypothetical protein
MNARNDRGGVATAVEIFLPGRGSLSANAGVPLNQQSTERRFEPRGPVVQRPGLCRRQFADLNLVSKTADTERRNNIVPTAGLRFRF